MKHRHTTAGGALRRPVLLSLTAALVGVALPQAPAMAADTGALLRSLQQLQNVLDQSERDSATRRAQQEAEQRQREAAEAARKQQAAAEQQRAAQARSEAQARELAALSPPPEWASRLVLNRKLLAPGAQGNAQAYDIVARGAVATSDDGSLVAFVNAAGQVVVQPVVGGTARTIASLDASGASTLWFVGNDAVIVNRISPAPASVMLVDLNGKTLKSLPAGWSVYPSQGYAFASDRTYSPKRCTHLTAYDARGTVVADLDFSAQPAEQCDMRRDVKGQFVASIVRGGLVTLMVNGQVVANFTADERTAGEYSSVNYTFTADRRFAVSSVHGSDDRTKTMPFRVWDIAGNKLQCEIARNDGWLSEDKLGRVSITTPAAGVDLATCQLQPVGVAGVMSRSEDFAAVYDKRTGQVSVLDPATLAVRTSFQSALRGDAITVMRTAPNSPYLIVGNHAYGAEKAEDYAQVFDMRSGQMVQQVPGRIRAFGGSVQYTVLDTREWGKTGVVKLTRVMQPDAGGAEAARQKFLEALNKDKYETAAEYRVRVGKLTQPFEMDVRVADYHADGAYFAGTYQGVPIGVPMSAAQARRLDGQSTLKVRGQLAVADEDFVELRNASVALPGGGTVAVPQSKLPARHPNAALANAAAGASAGNGQGAAMVKTSGTAGAAGSAQCRGDFGYLAPQLRPYTTSELSQVRQSILSMTVPQALADMKRQGVTASTVAQRVAQVEAEANDAARTADQTDGGGGGASSIQRAKTDALPLNWPCEGIHSSAVCVYIIKRWEALVTREAGNMLSRCSI